MELIFEKSRPGLHAFSLPPSDVPEYNADQLIPRHLRRSRPAGLPQVSETEAVRHYTALSSRNHGVDSGFYPLGSCTMKYNPKINEDIAAMPGFSAVHPLLPAAAVQGCLAVMYELDQALCRITGMAQFTLQPAAGAHGELTGLMIIRAWHQQQNETTRDEILIPDSAHGTNPASAALAGFKVVEIPSDADGCVDLQALRRSLGPKTAGIMLTNPNTLGLFDRQICAIADAVHQAGGLLYYDGANANAILGQVRPGDMGFDIVHLNLHKTFSTPHGGGGPGAGPVGVTEALAPFLPGPLVVRQSDGTYDWETVHHPLSIGRMKAFHGHFAVFVRALAYIWTLGDEGLREVSETAVLNANYVQASLRETYDLPFDRLCMHECVLSARQLREQTGISALDVAKRLLDDGFHPPTIYFPLIVKEALMIEPTETENKAGLDAFILAMRQIAAEAAHSPETVRQAPQKTPVSRLDETAAARHPILRWKPPAEADQ
ncbi:MAG: aminomethyl-transferring glycine dehydrogenase subunit GcvPB [Eubacteriales bacterium]|nr:aminomethyl-transferring glycine dehydrogenase subunit GcvPB [Eubacteriales bacterium]